MSGCLSVEMWEVGYGWFQERQRQTEEVLGRAGGLSETASLPLRGGGVGKENVGAMTVIMLESLNYISWEYIKQMFWTVEGLFDQIIHSTENVDINGLFKHLYPKVMVGLPLLRGINPASCFPRTAIGYEATCYSHIWSEVFAADIFASKFHDDIFNLQTGLQFRNKVLAPGRGKDSLEMLSDFLGREPSTQAFLDNRADIN
ncbi:hypothetical protein KY290_036297 [Solanum tuberosum]|uniref:Peptidase M3A/M3B catalytic domain-containing protein n=1 Tax=Solanum tuberosum TaxID=4113 RepID=A0ABQ7TS85_SOLTU|nr:hypothetical protein KY285_035577 [Solanum tuberosum]KAH0737592.1 hypothetical protein KY290_036297 [Solanum tuberosum]